MGETLTNSTIVKQQSMNEKVYESQIWIME